MSILASDEALLYEAIESIADRGVLGYEKIVEDDNQIIFRWSHARSRQQKAMFEKYRIELENAARITFRIQRCFEGTDRTSEAKSFRPLPDATGDDS